MFIAKFGHLQVADHVVAYHWVTTDIFDNLDKIIKVYTSWNLEAAKTIYLDTS